MPLLNISATILSQKAHALPEYKEDITPYLQGVLAHDLKIIEDLAHTVADKQKEISMPLLGLDILQYLRYARYPEGEIVLPHHALNAVTKAFFDEVYATNCWLTRFSIAPELEGAIFDPKGPQRLRLHWARC
jgi:hypothetical protein